MIIGGVCKKKYPAAALNLGGKVIYLGDFEQRSFYPFLSMFCFAVNHPTLVVILAKCKQLLLDYPVMSKSILHK